VELFQRSINARVDLLGEDTIGVNIKLDDTHHEIRLNMKIRAETQTITEINGEFIRSPFDRCRDTLNLLQKLVGVHVAPGVRQVVARKVGGQEGCTHLYELTMEALRVFMQGYYRKLWKELPTDERLVYSKKMLKGECYIYSHPEIKVNFLLDKSNSK